MLIFMTVFLYGCSDGETTESGGALKEWKEKILENTGPDSEASKTIVRCETAINKQKETCSQREGWSIVNAMEITDFKSSKSYSFQDVQQGGCPGKSPDGKEYDRNVETGTIVTQTESDSSYQVACNVVCNWWECKEKTDRLKPETWTGEITAKLDDLGASCSDGEVSLSYIFTLNSPVSLVSAIKGEQEITLWSEPSYKEASGIIKGTAVVNNQPSKSGVIYCELEEGQSEEVPINFFATGDESAIQISEPPGSQQNIRTPRFGQEYYFHEEAGLTDQSFLAGFPPILLATSISETKISGSLKPGFGYLGTFTLTKTN